MADLFIKNSRGQVLSKGLCYNTAVALADLKCQQLVCLSDVHADSTLENNYIFLLHALRQVTHTPGQTVVLLGDVFHLMIGHHQQYFSVYHEFWDILRTFFRANMNIIWLAGNHDFHLSRLMDIFIRKLPCKEHQFFIYSEVPLLLKLGSATVYLSHGDEFDRDNFYYQRYKKWIRSSFARFVAQYVVPHWLLEKIGSYFSIKSKENQRNYDEGKELLKFRSFIDDLKEYYDFIILGHSHVSDLYRSKRGAQYVNAGFLPKNKKLVSIDSRDLKVIFASI